MEKKLLSIILSLVLVFSVINVNISSVQAGVCISKTSLIIEEGSRTQLKVFGTNRRVNWKTSNQRVATVNRGGYVTGRSTGRAVISANIGNKKYKCIVKVLPIFNLDDEDFIYEIASSDIKYDGMKIIFDEDGIDSFDIINEDFDSKSGSKVVETEFEYSDDEITLEALATFTYGVYSRNWELEDLNIEVLSATYNDYNYDYDDYDYDDYDDYDYDDYDYDDYDYDDYYDDYYGYDDGFEYEW